MQESIEQLHLHTQNSLRIKVASFRRYADEWTKVEWSEKAPHNTKEYCDKHVAYWLYKAAELEYLIPKAPVKIIAIYEDGKEQVYE